MTSNIQCSFKALADPTRRQILSHLSHQEMTIGEITNRFDMTRAAIKKHLDILEKGSLISVEKNGRERVNSLEAEGLKTVSDWLDCFDQSWDDYNIDHLQMVVASNDCSIDN